MATILVPAVRLVDNGGVGFVGQPEENEMAFGYSTERTKKLCVDLVTIIHARRNVERSFEHEEVLTPIYRDFIDYQNEMLRAKAIELAVNFRIFIDLKGNKLQLKSKICPGRFRIPNTKPMSPRDCANKLIHTEKFFGVGEMNIGSKARTDNEPPRRGLNEAVVLGGTYKSENWECEIDLLAFAEGCHELVCQWENTLD